MITRYFILSDLEGDKKSVEKFMSLRPDEIMKQVLLLFILCFLQG